MEAILEGMAEYYSEELSIKVKRGMTENIIKGLVVGGKTPLGYKIENKKYVIDPKTAPIVKDIFNMYAAGNTITQIINYLNDKRYKTVTGRSFTKTSLETVLRNKKYIDIYEHSGHIVKGGTPVILEKTLFEKVQAMLEKNKKAPARGRGEIDYLLTTKLFCDCGSTMSGTSANNKNQTYYYYQCIKKCGQKAIPKDKLEYLIVDTAMEVISDPETISHISKTIVALTQQERAEDTMLIKLEQDIKDTEKYIHNLTKALKNGLESETIQSELMSLEKDLKAYKEEYAHMDLTHPQITEKQIIFWLTSFHDTDKENLSDRKKLIDTFIRAVYVKDEEVTITFNYSDSDFSNAPPREPHRIVRVRTDWWG